MNARGLRDILEKGAPPVTNLALQECELPSGPFEVGSEERNLVIACFNVLIEELAATPSARQRPGTSATGLQLPAIYALASEGPNFVIKPNQVEKAEIIVPPTGRCSSAISPRPIHKFHARWRPPRWPRAKSPCANSFVPSAAARSTASNSSAGLPTPGLWSWLDISLVEAELPRGIPKIFLHRRRTRPNGLVDPLVNSMEYAGLREETVPYLRDLGEEAQESAGNSNRKLFRFSAPRMGRLSTSPYTPPTDSHRQPTRLWRRQRSTGFGLWSHLPVSNSVGTNSPCALRLQRTAFDGGQRPEPVWADQWPNVQRSQAPGGQVVSMPATANEGRRPEVNEAAKTAEAVIRAVYAQVIGNALRRRTRSLRRISPEEWRNLPEGIHSLIARSKAFQKAGTASTSPKRSR